MRLLGKYPWKNPGWSDVRPGCSADKLCVSIMEKLSWVSRWCLLVAAWLRQQQTFPFSFIQSSPFLKKKKKSAWENIFSKNNLHVLKYKFTDAWGYATNVSRETRTHTLHCGVRNPSPPTSHLNFHCYCNQWFPSNVIYFHSILTCSAVKEIGVKQPADTNKDKNKSRSEEEVDFAACAFTKTEDMLW